MSPGKNVLVTCMGSVWRLSRSRYLAFLSDAAEGKAWDLDEFGTRLGNLQEDVTDMGAAEAGDRLADLRAAIAEARRGR